MTNFYGLYQNGVRPYGLHIDFILYQIKCVFVCRWAELRLRQPKRLSCITGPDIGVVFPLPGHAP